MASAVPFATKVNPLPWLAVYTEPQLDRLNESIQVLPTLFRILAALCFLPVAFLAFADVIGWAFFKLVLRPLGYASTIRFKDPEPPAFISSLSNTGHDSSVPSSASSEVSNSPISSPASTSASLPAIDEALHGPRQTSRSKSRSRNRKASISSASDGEVVYSSKSMNRHRAPSIGFDGPLFGEDTTDGEAQTPGVESDAGGSDYFAGSKAGGAVKLGAPPVGPRRTSTLQPSLSFTKAKGD
ncbi:hypothetical protein JCM16303_004889 [Sporobolomyces ruberrimus]